jgi:hypothetical protein
MGGADKRKDTDAVEVVIIAHALPDLANLMRLSRIEMHEYFNGTT